ncbi:gametogenetin-binding protein 2 isoform 2-T2 [Rhinophrynus dorsalis]
MARLVAVCRDGEEEFPFDKRQIPLYIDDSLTMVMEFPNNMLPLDKQQIDTVQLQAFIQRLSLLKEDDLNTAMVVTPFHIYNALLTHVHCVGCRRSVERLLTQLVESGIPGLDPLSVGAKGVLTLSHSCMSDASKLYTLFYLRGTTLSDMIDAIPKSKKNNRCQLHSLDTHKKKPLGDNWIDVWENMSPECREEVVLISSCCLLETLEKYLRKHKFCTDCKNKVLRAYKILIGELDCSKEKGFCAAVYQGLRSCPHQQHIHLCCEKDFIAPLLGRAELEFIGGRRERHAKTIDIAQEEVLTCLGIQLYKRLHRIWQNMKAEEQTWQMLFCIGVDSMRKSFEARVLELKQEKKRQKKKNRRKNKSALNETSVFMETGCNSCNNFQDHRISVDVTGGDFLCSHKFEKGLTTHCTGSDCGYSSSSEPGSPEGSVVACTEDICHHDEAGEDSCVNFDKEEEDGDSCVECFANVSGGILKGKQMKKCKPFTCENKNHSKMDHSGKKEIKTLKDMLDELECTEEDHDGLTQDEIQIFIASNQSFYSNRQQLRQQLKEQFYKYCLLHGHRNITTGANI